MSPLRPTTAAFRVGLAANDTDDTGLSDARGHLVAAEGAELLGDEGGGAVRVVEDLGVLVEVAPPCCDFGQKLGEAVSDRHLALLRGSRRLSAARERGKAPREFGGRPDLTGLPAHSTERRMRRTTPQTPSTTTGVTTAVSNMFDTPASLPTGPRT